MSRRYIPIETKSDIDISKIGVGNIENRYIDKNGQRYATRFNMRTRKVEVVAIALGNDEVIQAKLNQQQKSPEESADSAAPQNVPEGRIAKPDWVIKAGLTAAESFNLQEFFPKIDSESSKFSERIRGIISNIKNSDVFESAETETGKDFILELTTFFDREIQDNLSQAQNLVVEFTRFPKPPSNYYIHLDRKQKVAVEPLSEDEQMEYFKAYMIGVKYLKALEACLSLLSKIKDQQKVAKTNNLSVDKKTFYENAVEATDFVKESIENEVREVIAWMEQAGVY